MADLTQAEVARAASAGKGLASVDILMATFRRPSVTDALKSLAALDVPQGLRVRVIVADNDDTPSAEALVTAFAETFRFPLRYVHAPARNISIARNALLDAADADWVAFIDDDERARPDWLANLIRRAEETGADAVFGPCRAVYDEDAPAWMREQDHHSSVPQRRGGVVETGIAGNALIRWRGGMARDFRFNVARGRFQGEDTEFFRKLFDAGALLEIADDAIVDEPVAKGRLDYQWIRNRKYASGYSYAVPVTGGLARAKLLALASVKAATCGLMAVTTLGDEGRRNTWALRGWFHAGVVRGCLGLGERQQYGG